jgi:hypothetical protein
MSQPLLHRFPRFLLPGIGLTLLFVAMDEAAFAEGPPAWIKVAPDRKSFVESDSEKPFYPWGFNYDHDAAGRLIEDYWDKEWEKIKDDFGAMKKMGANTVRIHLQMGAFMENAALPRAESLQRLKKLVRLAADTGLYLNLTGLGCFHKKDVPKWYETLGEKERWDAQAVFWKAVAQTVKDEPAVFCFDLMNEPVVSGDKRGPGEWLGQPFAGKHFVQFITLDPQERSRPAIAKAWIDFLVSEVRTVDSKHLITVGLVDWSLERPGLTSGFVPDSTCAALDFLSVHLYPEKGRHARDLSILKGFSVGKPLVLEETYPLNCSVSELAAFLKSARPRLAGAFSFYWGRPLSELKRSPLISDAMLAQWMEAFITVNNPQ